MMKKRHLLLLCFIVGIHTLQAQAFHQAFSSDQAYAQFTNAPKPYASRSTLNSGIDLGYQAGIKVKSLVAMVEGMHPNLSVSPLEKALILKIDVALKEMAEDYHLLLLNKKGAFIENFPLSASITLDCRQLKSGTYFLRLCARDSSTPLQEYKLVKY